MRSWFSEKKLSERQRPLIFGGSSRFSCENLKFEREKRVERGEDLDLYIKLRGDKNDRLSRFIQCWQGWISEQSRDPDSE
jgi:hypothetical protein